MSDYRFRLRRGTAAEWAAKDPVLLDGEPGLEKDTGRLKLGDGGTPWTDLPYVDTEGLSTKADAADVAASLATKANAATVGALSTRVDTTETRVGTVEDELPTKADQSAVTALQGEVSGRLSATSLSSTIAREVAPVAQATSTKAPTVVTVVSAQVDEAAPTSGTSTRTVDTVNYKIGNQGQKFTMAAAGTPSIIWDRPTDPIRFKYASRVCMWLYLPDATKVTSVTLDLYVDNPAGQGHTLWQQTWAAAKLRTGWNLLAYQATAGNVGQWDKVYRTRLQVACNAATDFTVGHIWLDCQPKAQLLFIEDRGYKTFKDLGLPDLRRLGIPVTWALDPLTHGTSVGTKSEVITDADVEEFAAAGDSISIHAYDGAVTATMTADQIRTDALKAIRWLQQRGHAGRMWRAAWTQNDAPQHAAAQPYFLAYATPSSAASLACWPPFDRWNIPRLSLQGLSNAAIDTYFAQLEKTHQLMVIYTHGIHTDGGTDATPAQWAYFIAKVEAAVEAGWLEGVTFEDLFARSGGKFKQAFGNAQAEFFDETGTLVRKSML